MDRFVWLLYPGFGFELIRPRVNYGGLGLCNDYHLEAVNDTQLKECIGMFPPFMTYGLLLSLLLLRCLPIAYFVWRNFYYFHLCDYIIFSVFVIIKFFFQI